MVSINISNIKKKLPVSLIGLILFNAILFIGLSFLSPTFLTLRNIRSLMLRMSELSMLTLAQTLVMICGGMDLTVGSVMALSGTVCGLMFQAGFNPLFTVAGALLAGAAAGALNSFLVVNLRIQSFIATVATNSIFRSVVYLLLKGRVLSAFPESYVFMGSTYIAGFPVLFLAIIVFAVALHILLRKTALGRSVLLLVQMKDVRISPESAQKHKVFCFHFKRYSLCSGRHNVHYAHRCNNSDAGLNSPLEVVTAVLIGGASVRGGKAQYSAHCLAFLQCMCCLTASAFLDSTRSGK